MIWILLFFYPSSWMSEVSFLFSSPRCKDFHLYLEGKMFYSLITVAYTFVPEGKQGRFWIGLHTFPVWKSLPLDLYCKWLSLSLALISVFLRISSWGLCEKFYKWTKICVFQLLGVLHSHTGLLIISQFISMLAELFLTSQLIESALGK